MIEVECPACGKAYRVGENAAGKKFRCKSCEEIVPVPAAARADEYDDFGGGFDDYGTPAGDRDDFADAYSPRPKGGAGRPQTRRKKPVKKRSSSGGKTGIIIGAVVGGIAVVALLGVGVAFAVRNMGSNYAKHEKMADELVGHMEELATAIESVRDQPSARAAATRINAVCDKLDGWAKRAKELPKITKRDDDKLQEKYMPKLNALADRMKTAGFRAGLASKGDPAFVAAVNRLEQAGRNMQRLGKGS